jgi:hypothetical protein
MRREPAVPGLDALPHHLVQHCLQLSAEAPPVRYSPGGKPIPHLGRYANRCHRHL